MRLKKLAYWALPVCMSVLLAACSSDSNNTSPILSLGFTISGTVSGLAQEAKITLSNDNGDVLVVLAQANADTHFKFKKLVNSGGNYAVTVNAQPSGIACSVVNATGTGVVGNVDNVRVICGASVLHALVGNDGSYPQTNLLSLNNLLYGTTSRGGAGGGNSGTIFQVNPATGVFTVLSAFNGNNGKAPFAGLVAGGDGKLYGTTFAGGILLSGNIFNIDPANNNLLTSLYSFNGGNDGSSPFAGLVFDGTFFYGTTNSDGLNLAGTVFKVDALGNITTLHTFAANGNEGLSPASGLVFGTDSNLYGTTSLGGEFGNGTIYKISRSGTFTLLHALKATDGTNPQANLVLASDGNFYGTTARGGSNSCNCGTVYKIDPQGNFSVLHSFAGQPTDGGVAQASLIIGTDGYLYGTTNSGGTNNKGSIYRVSLTGEAYSVLHSFNSAIDGSGPSGPLTELSDGHFYGTTTTGGSGNQGTVFRF